jgi:hypothetical protein
MRQLRTQGLQQQTAALQLQQEQMALKSTQGFMKAYQEAGGDEVKMKELAPKYGVMPEHMLKFQGMLDEQANKRAQTRLYGTQADKDAMEAQDREHDLLYQAYEPVWAEKDPVKQQALVGQINQTLTKQGWDPKKLLQYTGPDTIPQAKAAYTTWTNIKAKAEEAQKKAEKAKAEAETKKLGLETENLELQQVIREVQNAPVDPKTGGPRPDAVAEIQKKHPNVILPPGPWTAESTAKFIRSAVPTEKQPEYDINAMKARLGLMGNTEFDQYQLRFAQSLNKKPGELDFPEFRKVVQQYATDKQDPNLLTALLGLRGAQELIARGQAGAILTPEQLQNNARDLLNGDLAPEQIKDLRAGRVNQGPQIIEAARTMARAEGRPFSLFDLEQQATQRQKTLEEFTTTQASHAGGQLLALNTMIHHADLYLDAVAALKNGTFKAGNAVYNAVATAFGAAPPTEAALLARFFASETGKVASGGVPAEGEINGMLKTMSTDGSPEAMERVGKRLIEIAAGRMGPLKARRDNARLQKLVPILDPDSQEILARRGFDPETMKPVTGARRPRPPAGGTTGKIVVKAGDGTLHPFDTEAQAKIFEDSVRAAGGTTTRQ